MCICEDSRMLDEYEILKIFLEITSVKNSSRASVKIVFKRRIEYHLTNTFLQVFIKETSPQCINGLIPLKSVVCISKT